MKLKPHFPNFSVFLHSPPSPPLLRSPSSPFHSAVLESLSKANWCPGPGCKNALILLTGNNHPKVTCKCTHTFCWKCAKEAHQPIACSTFCNWTMECVVQSENWLCRASWLDNGSWNGDEFKHTCSKGKQKVENDDREEKGRIAQDSLNKYTNSYNHWMANEMCSESNPVFIGSPCSTYKRLGKNLIS
uniref:IBR domain-containing protein n=1 Tax=Chenopodium quinoa TaxID=63459 RepID=A0A803MRZ7_CHEQI